LANLKIVTHHMGGMAPISKAVSRLGSVGNRTSDGLCGAAEDAEAPARLFQDVLCRHGRVQLDVNHQMASISSIDRVLFASDAPFDPEKGRCIRG
jgi:hypothetical protein